MGKKQWAQKVVPLTCEKWSFTRGLSFKRKILEFRTEGSLWKLYWKLYRSTQLRRRKSTGRDSRCCAKEKMSHSFDKYDNKHTYTRSSWRASLPFAEFFERPKKEIERRLRAKHRDSSVTFANKYLQCSKFWRNKLKNMFVNPEDWDVEFAFPNLLPSFTLPYRGRKF